MIGTSSVLLLLLLLVSLLLWLRFWQVPLLMVPWQLVSLLWKLMLLPLVVWQLGLLLLLCLSFLVFAWLSACWVRLYSMKRGVLVLMISLGVLLLPSCGSYEAALKQARADNDAWFACDSRMGVCD